MVDAKAVGQALRNLLHDIEEAADKANHEEIGDMAFKAMRHLADLGF